MHLLNLVTIFIALTLVGVEFSVSAFINSAAWRLEPKPQLEILGRVAFVFGRVMPVWYPVSTVLLGIETWIHRHTAESGFLLAAFAIWILVSAASIVLLVPLNTRVEQGVADWQQIHRTWDRRHRVRIAALAIAAVLLTYALVR